MKIISLIILVCMVFCFVYVAGCISPVSSQSSDYVIQAWETGPFTQMNLSYESGHLSLSPDGTGVVTEKLVSGDTYVYPGLWFRNPGNTTQLRIFYTFWYNTVSADGFTLRNTYGQTFTKTDDTPGFVGSWTSPTGNVNVTYYENYSADLEYYYEGEPLATYALYWEKSGKNTYIIGYNDQFSVLSLVEVGDTLVDSDGHVWVKVP